MWFKSIKKTSSLIMIWCKSIIDGILTRNASSTKGKLFFTLFALIIVLVNVNGEFPSTPSIVAFIFPFFFLSFNFCYLFLWPPRFFLFHIKTLIWQKLAWTLNPTQQLADLFIFYNNNNNNIIYTAHTLKTTNF